MVGDGDTMRVASEIVQHVLGAAERRLGIHNPILPIKLAHETGEVLLLMKRSALAEEAQLAAGKKPSQSSDKLPAKNATEHLDREKEVGTRSDPTGVVWSEATSRNHAVDVRMRGEGLSPGVQNRKKSQLCAEVLRSSGNVEYCGGTGLEEQGE